MFKNILVPLDGSPMSEQALPVAVSIARRSGANLRFVHIRKPPLMPLMNRDMPLPPPSPPAREQDYLNRIARQVRQTAKLDVHTAVLEGPTAETVAEHARGVQADLMVLTTHGRGPLSRFWMGSVADELVRRGPVPLLIQRPTGDEALPDRDLRFENVLIALDGSKLAEAVLAPAVALAKNMKAAITLFRVVEPMPVLVTDGMMPQPVVLDANLLDELKTQARTYLESVAEPLRAEGLRVATRIAIDDRIAGAILDEAKAFDLVAVATHGRSKFARAMLGSVADKVVRGSTAPTLIVRPAKP